MIKFVNAKINIGLNIVARREDGYHDLETVFFPVGLESGMPQQPQAFDDILEVTVKSGEPSSCRFQLMGRKMDIEPEKNLVVKATTLFLRHLADRDGLNPDMGQLNIVLDKHLPDGAGLGGGSADASFTLLALNEIFENPFGKNELLRMALKLGADCPFFIYNRPCFASGIGERLEPIELDLKDVWLMIVKPPIHVSTKEAFRGIEPKKPGFDLRFLPYLPLEEWREKVFNDFEMSLFPLYPELEEIKKGLYESGATYASMTGSGSALYGLYRDREKALQCSRKMMSTYEGVWLFKL